MVILLRAELLVYNLRNMNDRIKEMHKYFGVYGYGCFDLTQEDVEEFLICLNSKNYKKKLKELYERLEQKRMG